MNNLESFNLDQVVEEGMDIFRSFSIYPEKGVFREVIEDGLKAKKSLIDRMSGRLRITKDFVVRHDQNEEMLFQSVLMVISQLLIKKIAPEDWRKFRPMQTIFEGYKRAAYTTRGLAPEQGENTILGKAFTNNRSLPRPLFEKAMSVIWVRDGRRLEVVRSLSEFSSFEAALDHTIYNPESKLTTQVKHFWSYFSSHEDEASLVDIRLFFENFATSLSEIIQIYKKPENFEITISVHPIDFLNLSNNSAGWRSCYNLNGEFAGSTLMLASDGVSAVAYLHPKGDLFGKKLRALLHFGEDGEYVLVNKAYPSEEFARVWGFGDAIGRILEEENILKGPVVSKTTTDFYCETSPDMYSDAVHADSAHILVRKEDEERDTEYFFEEVGQSFTCLSCGENVAEQGFLCSHCITGRLMFDSVTERTSLDSSCTLPPGVLRGTGRSRTGRLLFDSITNGKVPVFPSSSLRFIGPLELEGGAGGRDGRRPGGRAIRRL